MEDANLLRSLSSLGGPGLKTLYTTVLLEITMDRASPAQSPITLITTIPGLALTILQHRQVQALAAVPRAFHLETCQNMQKSVVEDGWR